MFREPLYNRLPQAHKWTEASGGAVDKSVQYLPPSHPATRLFAEAKRTKGRSKKHRKKATNKSRNQRKFPRWFLLFSIQKSFFFCLRIFLMD